MVNIREFKDVTVVLYRTNDKGELEAVGKITSEASFHDVRAQIKQGKLKGYSIMYRDHIIKIDSNGELDVWPVGLYDQITNQLLRLI